MLDKTCFFDYMKELQNKLADVREVEGVSVEDRLRLINLLDVMIIQKFKVAGDEIEKPKDNWV